MLYIICDISYIIYDIYIWYILRVTRGRHEHLHQAQLAVARKRASSHKESNGETRASRRQRQRAHVRESWCVNCDGNAVRGASRCLRLCGRRTSESNECFSSAEHHRVSKPLEEERSGAGDSLAHFSNTVSKRR